MNRIGSGRRALAIAFVLGGLIAAAIGRAHAAVPGYQTLKLVFTLQPHRHGGSVLYCPAGKIVLSGGFHIEVPGATSPNAPFYPTRSAPILDNGKYGWIVSVRNDAPVPITINIYAICADFL